LSITATKLAYHGLDQLASQLFKDIGKSAYTRAVLAKPVSLLIPWLDNQTNRKGPLSGPLSSTTPELRSVFLRQGRKNGDHHRRIQWLSQFQGGEPLIKQILPSTKTKGLAHEHTNAYKLKGLKIIPW